MNNQPQFTLNELKDKLLAGKASLDQEEIADLIKTIVSELGSTLSAENSEQSLNTETWLNILEGLFTSDLSEHFMKEIDADLFYSLGDYLNSLKDHSDKNIIPLIYHYLNLFRVSEFLQKIYNERKWDKLVYDLIVKSNYSFDILFKQRVNQYKKKKLFRVIRGENTIDYSWQKTSEIINAYSASIKNILNEFPGENKFAAFLLENSLDMALLDLSCLTSGIVNVMIPANSVSEHISFILNQTKAPILFVDDEKQFAKLRLIKKEIPDLKKVIMLSGNAAEDWVINFEEFKSQSNSGIKNDDKQIKPDSLATIMYTSGTTGEPKGIMFSHTNIVYKRFCRAMAIPGIGDKDRFLAFLPLYHTFGRWFEMTGAIFWGAEYCFMENPSVETMIENMQLVNPSIFISIPKKWIQLYEFITSRIDIETDDEKKIRDEVSITTGGNLKWGLSAAGFLPPDIFRFFQRYGVELMSGFGMTEATGGITMTPPFEYRENSLGKALPGIEIKLGEDGEILIRGPYVMINYYNEDLSDTFDNDGWLPTGDIMKMDADGFIEIIDRKKEIYKNVKGETIAPQKIENLFRDFEFVKQVFLVGDHRQFNTVLIYPDEESPNSPLKKMDDQQKQEYFSTLIVTVNNFLAPFERILDFRLINRPFSLDYGELTPKSTYKRRVIEKNFAKLIDSMYEKSHIELRVGKVDVKIPNWFLREKSILSRDIISEDSGLKIPKLHLTLSINTIPDEKDVFKIGSYYYFIRSRSVDLQEFLTNPFYWLGNKELYDFAGASIIQWSRKDQKNSEISFRGRAENIKIGKNIIEEFENITSQKEFSLYSLNLALLIIQAENAEDKNASIEFIKAVLSDNTHHLYNFTFECASRDQLAEDKGIKRFLLSGLILKARKEKLQKVLINYLNSSPDLLDDNLIEHIDLISRGDENLNEIEAVLEHFAERIPSDVTLSHTPIPSLFKLLVSYGISHPVTYKRIRRTLLLYELYAKIKRLRQLAIKARLDLRKGLRNWLGENQKVAIDPETGEEYTWQDVFVFDEAIPVDDKHILSEALIENPVLKEAVFLFSGSTLILLNNILPSGVWISFLSSSQYRNVYRVTVQTRFQGAFDFTLHLNKKLSSEELEEEIKWLVISGSEFSSERIASRFGGLWEEYNLWTEEYLSGESVSKYIKREYRSNDAKELERLSLLWRYFVWNASAAYLKFWKIAGYKLELENASPKNVIIPPHDYQTGTQITSFYKRKKTSSFVEFFFNFGKNFIDEIEKEYPELKDENIWNAVLSSIIEVEGTEQGIELITKLKREINKHPGVINEINFISIIDSFINNLKENGFLPKQLYFAIKRFNRWFNLNTDASLSAQAETLYDLYETYRLFDLEKDFPATRTRFFLETVFLNSSDKFKTILKDLVKKQRAKKVTKDESIKMIHEINFEFELSEKEQFFLARLSYPHLKPTDTASLLKVKSSAAFSAGLVVQQKDNDGNNFIIRNPISPKEISKLHKLFLETNLIVNFRPEHQYLIALSERGFIIGGLFYYHTEANTVQMEKIVVSDRYRRKGISEALMNELFNRMKSENVEYITTGFFRPEYFYRFGFKIERKYSGLVKELK